MKIPVNNGAHIEINLFDGMQVTIREASGKIKYFHEIPEHEIVMLLNYYKACKDGTIESDFIQA